MSDRPGGIPLNLPSLLLVDDETSFVEVLSRRLQRRGYSVSTAFSGPEALARMADAADLDVVILDVQMPGMDGIEVLRRIKERAPLLAVILLTAHATVASAVEGMKFGAFDYLVKPCDTQHLIDMVQQAADRRRFFQQRLRDARSKPYISKREREELIAGLLAEARRPAEK